MPAQQALPVHSESSCSAASVAIKAATKAWKSRPSHTVSDDYNTNMGHLLLERNHRFQTTDNDINASFHDLTTPDGNILEIEYTLEIHLEYASIPRHSRSLVAKSVGLTLEMTTY